MPKGKNAACDLVMLTNFACMFAAGKLWQNQNWCLQLENKWMGSEPQQNRSSWEGVRSTRNLQQLIPSAESETALCCKSTFGCGMNHFLLVWNFWFWSLVLVGCCNQVECYHFLKIRVSDFVLWLFVALTQSKGIRLRHNPRFQHHSHSCLTHVSTSFRHLCAYFSMSQSRLTSEEKDTCLDLSQSRQSR